MQNLCPRTTVYTLRKHKLYKPFNSQASSTTPHSESYHIPHSQSYHYHPLDTYPMDQPSISLSNIPHLATQRSQMQSLLLEISLKDPHLYQIKSKIRNLNDHSEKYLKQLISILIEDVTLCHGGRFVSYCLYRILLRFSRVMRQLTAHISTVFKRLMMNSSGSVIAINACDFELVEPSSHLEYVILMTDMYLFGVPIWPAEFQMTNILPLFQPCIEDILLKFGIQIFLHLTFFHPKHIKKNIASIQKFIAHKLDLLQQHKIALKAKARSIQTNILSQTLNQESLEILYTSQLEAFEKKLSKFRSSLESIIQNQQVLIDCFNRNNFIAMLDTLKKGEMEKIKEIYILKKECEEFSKVVEWTLQEKVLYGVGIFEWNDKNNLSSCQNEVEKRRPIGSWGSRGSQVCKLEQNLSFLEGIKQCTSIKQCEYLSNYFLSEMNNTKNREELIEYVINQCHHFANLPYVLKVIHILSLYESSIKVYCENKAKKITGFAPITIDNHHENQYESDGCYFKHKINPKYNVLICELTKLKLISPEILIAYVEFQIICIQKHHLSANSSHGNVSNGSTNINNSISMNQGTNPGNNNMLSHLIKEVMSLLGEFSHIMYYKQLQYFIRMNEIFSSIEQIIKHKIVHFHYDQLIQFKQIIYFITNGHHSLNNCSAIEQQYHYHVLNYQLLRNPSFHSVNLNIVLAELPDISIQFDLVRKTIHNLLMPFQNQNNKSYRHKSKERTQQKSKEKSQHKASIYNNQQKGNQLKVSKLLSEQTVEQQNIYKIEEISKYLLHKIDHMGYISTYYYASLLKELCCDEINQKIMAETMFIVETNIENDQQRSVHWSRFLGELYNYQIVGRKFVIDALYKLLAKCSWKSEQDSKNTANYVLQKHQQKKGLKGNKLQQNKEYLVFLSVLKCISPMFEPIKQQLYLHQQKSNYKSTLKFLLYLQKYLIYYESTFMNVNKILHLQEIEDIFCFFHPHIRDIKDIKVLQDILEFYTPQTSRTWNLGFILEELNKGKSLDNIQDQRYFCRFENLQPKQIQSDKKIKYKQKQKLFKEKINQDEAMNQIQKSENFRLACESQKTQPMIIPQQKLMKIKVRSKNESNLFRQIVIKVPEDQKRSERIE